MIITKGQEIKNDWLRVNNRRVELFKRQLIECQMRGSYQKDIDLNGIIRLISEMEFEIENASKSKG
jgi:hypothetical protein